MQPLQKLTDRQVETIRNRRASGVRVADLAEAYNVTPGMISQICLGHKRRNAPGPITASTGRGPKPKEQHAG